MLRVCVCVVWWKGSQVCLSYRASIQRGRQLFWLAPRAAREIRQHARPHGTQHPAIQSPSAAITASSCSTFLISFHTHSLNASHTASKKSLAKLAEAHSSQAQPKFACIGIGKARRPSRGRSTACETLNALFTTSLQPHHQTGSAVEVNDCGIHAEANNGAMECVG